MQSIFSTLALYVIVINTLVFNATRLYFQLYTFPKAGDTPPSWTLAQQRREREGSPSNREEHNLCHTSSQPDRATPSTSLFPTALAFQILSGSIPYECPDPSGSVPRCFKDGCAGQYKPPRTHHCRSCGVCKIGFDHHVSNHLPSLAVVNLCADDVVGRSVLG